MKNLRLEQLKQYKFHLYQQEKSPATIEKYSGAVLKFYQWLPEGKTVDKEAVIAYKAHLVQNHAPAGVNAVLAGVNSFLRFMGWTDCVVKPLHIQRKVFAEQKKELTKEEYQRLVDTAEGLGQQKLSLLLQLMASTGLRVSEVRYITVEAVEQGRAEINLKGKVRVILLPGKLCRKLRKFLRAEGIQSGPVFLSSLGSPLSRKRIWEQMKRLCRQAGVSPEKVFPHNLRHLFARTFYRAQKDLAKLADLLGHSSVETTRIYLLTSGTEHLRAMENLQLIC